MKSQFGQGSRGSVELPQAPDSQAFSRLELAALLGALGLLALLVLPALANNRERSSRVQCVNNLRLAGQALQQWSTEHDGRVPWRVPWCEGGTQVRSVGWVCIVAPPPWATASLNNNLWFQWQLISNELGSPKILACPSDAQKRPASSWSGSSDGGFLNAAYQNRAVSYLIGLDVFPETPQSVVAGDRNVRFNVNIGFCSSGIELPRGLNSASITFGIGGGLHVEAGNFLFTDGHVEELSSQAFVRRWLEISAGQGDTGQSGIAHFLTTD